LRDAQKTSKKRSGFLDFFKPKKTPPPVIELVHTSLAGGGGGAQANAPINAVVTPGFVPWAYPQNIGDPVKSHKQAVLTAFNTAQPAQASALRSTDPIARNNAVIDLLDYQRDNVPPPADNLVNYNNRVHRFSNILPMRDTHIGTRAGYAIGANNMVVDGKVVGMACSLPLNAQIGEMYNFLFEHNVQGVHVVMRDADLQLVNHANYFDPQPPAAEPVNPGAYLTSPDFTLDGFRINAVTHKIEIHDMGISTSSGRIKVEKVNEFIYDRGLESEIRCIDLKLTRQGVEREVRVLHTPNWVDQSNVPVGVLERLLELRETCFNGFSPDRILTHCRAGVGRTGTLVAAEVMRHMPGSNLADIVMSLRDSRNFQMVQTPGQERLLIALAEKYQYPIIDTSTLDPINP
ncbi:MAG: protein-tyrosine phosphatase family protein, partial [Shewanella sp.]